jgi:hypothetical protein
MTSRNSSKGKLDLWAKVIIAKNIRTNVPILGLFDECGRPFPAVVNVPLAEGEMIECVKTFKVIFSQNDVTEQFVCANKVILTIPFTAYFWIKTNLGFVNATKAFTLSNEIPVCKYIKIDGKPITHCEFRDYVDQSFAVACDYEMAYINILPKTAPTSQMIQVVLTATVIDKLGKYQDVLVYGSREDTCCIVDCCD